MQPVAICSQIIRRQPALPPMLGRLLPVHAVLRRVDAGGPMHQQPTSLRVLRDLERELSDDDDFRPAHRTSACFVLHEKDKVNDIFR